MEKLAIKETPLLWRVAGVVSDVQEEGEEEMPLS